MSFYKFVEKLSKIKNHLFLIMCLCVHSCNSIAFGIIHVYPLMILNICSSLFYLILVFLYKENRDYFLSLTYFEILIFCFISELFIGNFGYIYFVIGMVGVVCYLLSSKRKSRIIFQLIGIVLALAIAYMHVKNFFIFPQYRDICLPYYDHVCFINLFITLFTIFYCSSLYIVDLNLTKAKLDYNSNHDALTGLYNRRFLNHVMERNRAEHNSDFAIAMIDVDDFKKVNDSFGHAVGDLVLENLSKALTDKSRPDYLPVRWGGEEFLLYMPNSSKEEAVAQMKAICDCFSSSKVESGKNSVRCTVTVGVAMGTNIDEWEKVINLADEKLYYGKQHGKNCIID